MSEQNNAELIAALEQKIRKLEAKTDHIQEKPIKPTKEEWDQIVAEKRAQEREQVRAANHAKRLGLARERKAELEAVLPKFKAQLEAINKLLVEHEGEQGLDFDAFRAAGAAPPKLNKGTIKIESEF